MTPESCLVPSGSQNERRQLRGSLRLSRECRPLWSEQAWAGCSCAWRHRVEERNKAGGRRKAEGGGLRAVDGWVRSRGVAAPPVAPGPAGGRCGVGSREAVARKTRGEGYSAPAAAAAGEYLGPRPQEARKPGGRLETALLSFYSSALPQRPPLRSCSAGRARPARQCRRGNRVHDDARCAGSRGSGGCYGTEGFEASLP